MEKYSYIPWETGDVITADKLNKISRVLKEVSEEIANATGSDVENEESSILRQKLDSLIVVSSGLPTTEQYGRIWINTNEEQLEKVLITLDDLISNAKFYTTRTAYDKGVYLVAENRIYRVISSISARENSGWNSIKNKCELFVLIDHINDILHNFETILDHDFAASTQMTTNFLGISNISNINPDGTELINLSDLKIAYNELIRIINSSGASVSSLTITLLETMIQDSNNNINQINEQITDIYRSLGNHTEDISSINNNIATILSSINGLNNNIDTIENSIDSLDDDIDNISGALSSLGNPIVSVSKDSNGLHFIHSINELKENELETNNSNDTISIDTLLAGAVRYDKQEVLKGDNLNTALTNLGLNDINSLVSGSVRYDLQQSLQNSEKEQARSNIGALGSSDLNNLNSRVSVVENDLNKINNSVVDVSKVNDNLLIDYLSGDPKTIPISNGLSFDGGYVDSNTNLLHLTLGQNDIDNFSPIQLPSGTGGGGAAVGRAALARQAETSSLIKCIYGQDCILSFALMALDSFGNPVDNAGVGTWYVGGVVAVNDITILPNQLTLSQFNIGPYLKPGWQVVKLSVSIDTGGLINSLATISWSINAINLSIKWDYDISQINTTQFTDKWTVYGDIAKETHTIIDTEEQEILSTSKPGAQQSMLIPLLSHGVHKVTRWVSAFINSNDLIPKTSLIYSKEIIFVRLGLTSTIIALGIDDHPNESIIQYDTIKIPIVVYNPLSINSLVFLYEDNKLVGTWESVDRTIQTWYYTPVSAGEHVLKIVSNNILRNITLNVEEVDIGGTKEVSRDLAFSFKVAQMATNDAVRNWSSNGITATFSQNFDWINGGLHTELVGKDKMLQKYVCIKAGTTMTINYNLFATDPKINGMNFKIIYKIQNCSDYDAVVGKCYNELDNTGIKLFAHKATIQTNSNQLLVPYSEDDYLELEFDVYKNQENNKYIVAWLDGVITSFVPYSSDTFGSTPDGIVLGSEDCDINIYLVKFYSSEISLDLHIDNFIVDAPNSQEIRARYSRNDIINPDTEEIDYQKLADNNKDLRVWLYQIDRLPVDKIKKDPRPVTYFKQIWKNGGPEYQLLGKGTLGVQGTSSVQYIRGAANTDIQFTELTDGTGKNLLENGKYGNSAQGSKQLYYAENGVIKQFTVEQARREANLLNDEQLGPEWVPSAREDGEITHYIKAIGMKLNDDSCPITYSNTKVNFASCEQVNNMCNAAWYQKYNPYPSLTARDCMEFNIGVQFIQTTCVDTNDRTVFNKSAAFKLWDDNKNYHMYSIANMGTSKNNVHIFHDITNPNEICVEIKDNGSYMMRMTNPSRHTNIEDYFNGDLNSSPPIPALTWDGEGNYLIRYCHAGDFNSEVIDNIEPDPSKKIQTVKDAWKRLVWWFASNNPMEATNSELDLPEVYEEYKVKGHDRNYSSADGLKGQILKGHYIKQYAGTYTHDTFERRMAKMLNECEDYIVLDSLVYHFLYIERHTMVDNAVKNTFWSTTDLYHWDLSKGYDMDTSDGNNNQGQLVFDYGILFNEFNPLNGLLAFNGGQASWFNFIGNLYEACQIMFVDRENKGAWSGSAYNEFLTNLQKKVPERCWNQCYEYSYFRTDRLGRNWRSFLAGGQKTHQRKHYLYFQEYYLSSKFWGQTIKGSYIDFRAYMQNSWQLYVTNDNGISVYTKDSLDTTTQMPGIKIPKDALVTINYEENKNWTAVNWRHIHYNTIDGYVYRDGLGGILPKASLTMKMYNKMYASVEVGQQHLTTVYKLQKIEKGELKEIVFPSSIDTGGSQIKVFGAVMIKSIKGMENLYPDTCEFSQAIKLTELKLGSLEKGYINRKLQEIKLHNNQLLKHLLIQNCVANSPLDLTSCPGLLTLDTTGSTFTSYNFANGGVLTSAIIQQPTVLHLLNLSKLTDNNFIIKDYSYLTGILYENTPGVDLFTLIYHASRLNRLRALNINWTLENMALLNRIYKMAGYDDKDNGTLQSILTGTIYLSKYSANKLALFHLAWGEDLTIIPQGNAIASYTVWFNNINGEHILDAFGNPYTQTIDLDDYAYDPKEDDIPDPTYEDENLIYVFTGWSGLSSSIVGETTIVALYRTTKKSFEVKWYNTNNVLLASKTVLYGALAVYLPNTYNPISNVWTFEKPNAESQSKTVTERFSYQAKIPQYTDEEPRTYYVFKGWDQSTGHVTSNMNVYPVWETAERVAKPVGGSKLSLLNLNTAQIASIIKTNEISDYLNDRDFIDIKLGNDFDFSNVRSKVLANLQYYDLDPYMLEDTLFGINDPTFTLAIDFEFTKLARKEGQNIFTGTIFSCTDNYNRGLKIRYAQTSPSQNGSVVIQWGNKTATIGIGLERIMLVILHPANTNILNIKYVGTAYGNRTTVTSNLKMSEETLISDTGNNISNSIVLGGEYNEISAKFLNIATGWIHWCKIWYDDLGPDVIRQIASSPRSTLRMEYLGPNVKYLLPNGNYSQASFCSTHTLQHPMPINGREYTHHGWAGTDLRNYLNAIFYNALPFTWRALICLVQIPGFVGGGSTATQISYDYIYIPSYGEVTGGLSSTSVYHNERDRNSGQYTYMTGGYLWRARFAVYTQNTSTLPDHQKSGYTDPRLIDLGTEYEWDPVQGDKWIYIDSNNNANIRLYLDENTTSKHNFFDSRMVPAGTENTYYNNTPHETFTTTSISATLGTLNLPGGWLTARSYWLRTPSLGGDTQGTYQRVYQRGTSLTNSTHRTNATVTYSNSTVICFSIGG